MPNHTSQSNPFLCPLPPCFPSLFSPYLFDHFQFTFPFFLSLSLSPYLFLLYCYCNKQDWGIWRGKGATWKKKTEMAREKVRKRKTGERWCDKMRKGKWLERRSKKWNRGWQDLISEKWHKGKWRISHHIVENILKSCSKSITSKCFNKIYI